MRRCIEVLVDGIGRDSRACGRRFCRLLVVTEQHATDVVESDRLALNQPFRADQHELFSILSDPRVWTHFPSLRQTNPAQTLAMIDRWIGGWKAWGLDTWLVRLKGDSGVIGYGGCSMRAEGFWNLGYRLAAEAQGHGYATELAAEAVQRANMTHPERPLSPSQLAATLR